MAVFVLAVFVLTVFVLTVFVLTVFIWSTARVAEAGRVDGPRRTPYESPTV